MNHVNQEKFKGDIFKYCNKSIFHKCFWQFFFINFFFTHIKMPKNLSAEYYQENKEILLKEPCERYQNLSKEKEKKWQYGCEYYKNLSEDEKF